MSRTLKLYKSYSFRDKDPIIDTMRTMIADEKVSYAEVSEQSGVSHTTLHNWFKGTTKRPQYATVMAVAQSLGYRVEWVNSSKVVKLRRKVS
jgi:transcriptional regulator with XRE-family HTH domain